MRYFTQDRNTLLSTCQRAVLAALTLWVLVLLIAVTTLAAQGQTFAVLQSFQSDPSGQAGKDGGSPFGVVVDNAGNVYGTATVGGDLNCYTPLANAGCGTVFQINKNGFSLVHTFEGVPFSDGIAPTSSILDINGNLYGMTQYGSNADCSGGNGCGTVWTVNKNKKDHEQILFSFDSNDGSYPSWFGGLLPDGAGGFYGTTSSGGKNDWGVIFHVAKSKQEPEVLYSFTGVGGGPSSGLIQDNRGYLYGTTFGDPYNHVCGNEIGDNCGTIFRFDPTKRKLITLYTFGYSKDGPYGGTPLGGVVMDSIGNLYGATLYQSGKGNPSECGTVYELSTKSKLTILHSFTGRKDGCNPRTNVLLDSTGNLYGTTSASPSTVFRVNKGQFKTLYTLNPDSDGYALQGSIVMDSNGDIYGPTSYGGSGTWGTVWKLTP